LKDEEGDQTFEAGEPATAPVTAPAAGAATGTGEGNGNGTAASAKAAPEVQAEGTKRKVDEKEGVDGKSDAKKAKA
jgi:hypothetical protein